MRALDRGSLRLAKPPPLSIQDLAREGTELALTVFVYPSALQANLLSAPVRRAFRAALARFAADAPLLLMGHHDADGLAALAVLARAFRHTGRPVRMRVVGRGENPWSPEIAAELADLELGGII